MTTPSHVDLTDAGIERMLAERAGAGAPPDLVRSISRAVTDLPQRQRYLLSAVLTPTTRSGRVLAIAAAIALIVLAAAVAYIGAPLLRQQHGPVVPPPPSATPLAVASGEPTPSPVPTSTASPAPSLPAVAGPLLVYQAGKTAMDIYTLDVASGQRTSLGNLQLQAGLAAIQWSADRQRATIFRVGDGAQAIAQVDVTTGAIEPVELVSGGSSDAVSPAGDRVAHLDGDAVSGFSLSVVDLTGNEVYRTALPAGVVIMGGATWSPDGTAVAMSGCQPCDLLGKGPSTSNDWHLFVVGLDGSPIRQVTDSTAGSYGSIDWSSDGRSLAYTIDCTGTCPYGVGTVRLSDGVVQQVTTNAGDGDLAWSPDGRRLAFVRGSGKGRGVWVVTADGKNQTRLTTAAVDFGERSPIWSPDGSSIVYSKGVLSETGLGDLWIVSSTGGTPRLVVKNAVGDW
jgi:Tol biopolymer transport system component